MAKASSKDNAFENDYLQMTLASTIPPLEMKFSPINGCIYKRIMAYQSFTYMNSVIEGVIPPEQYTYAADETDRGVKLSIWNITQAIKAIQEFKKARIKFDFVTARVSPKLVNKKDFYEFIKSIFAKCKFDEPQKICLEFPRTVLFEELEQVRMALLNMKLLNAKTMMSGCGELDNPVSMLFSLPFDYVIMAPWLMDLADNRAKRSSFESFVSFLRTTGCEIIAEGVKNDEQIQVLTRADCYGYIQSPSYKGRASHKGLRITLDEAKVHDEDDEEEEE